MNVLGLPCWTPSRCSWNVLRISLKPKNAVFIGSKRKFATHREDFDFNSRGSTLSQSLDSKRQSEPRHDSVGPFQLGLSQAALRRGEKVPKWSELSPGGKVLRSTARTTNLGVILLGAGLSALLIYSLTSELFSKNSATVLYGDACERIKSSPKIQRYMNSPLTFHNNPPSQIRPRHRNRHVTSQIVLDSYGQEHMILSFYVQGGPEGSQLQLETSYIEYATEWVKNIAAVLPELKWDDAVEWSTEHVETAWDKSKRAFKYLSGAPTPPPTLPPAPLHGVAETKKNESSAWNFAGLFTGLRGPTSSTSDPTSRTEKLTFTDGDVHADLIRNKDGYFVFRYLLVDMPSSRDPNHVRVFVERGPGVRDNEPVMRWVTS